VPISWQQILSIWQSANFKSKFVVRHSHFCTKEMCLFVDQAIADDEMAQKCLTKWPIKAGK